MCRKYRKFHSIIMDILTPKGEETLRQELRAVELLQKKFPVQYVHTPKNKPASVDAVLVKDSEIVAVVETKCRQMTLFDLTHKFEGDWLITWDKVVAARDVALSLRVPFVGLLYLVPDDLLLVQKITDPDGEWTVGMRIKETATQRTVNGGTAVRYNAYICMEGATKIK